MDPIWDEQRARSLDSPALPYARRTDANMVFRIGLENATGRGPRSAISWILRASHHTDGP